MEMLSFIHNSRFMQMLMRALILALNERLRISEPKPYLEQQPEYQREEVDAQHIQPHEKVESFSHPFVPIASYLQELLRIISNDPVKLVSDAPSHAPFLVHRPCVHWPLIGSGFS
jgi:hypothetical protein